MTTNTINPRRLNQLNLLKWCILGIAIIDIFLLLFFNVTLQIFEKVAASATLPPDMTAEQLKEAIDFFKMAYWPVNLLGLLHLPLTILTFIKFHQKKWHSLILAYLALSVFIFPLGTFMAIVLYVFLYNSKGKDLFQK